MPEGACGGAGRTTPPPACCVLDIPSADVAGFSMGSAITQEPALRHPKPVHRLLLVSTDAPGRPRPRTVPVLALAGRVAPGERAFYEAFFAWVSHTPRAHADGIVDQMIEEAVTFLYQRSVEAFQAQV
jgi:pimeloyl-ACP methyl ester carboxylesterase